MKIDMTSIALFGVAIIFTALSFVIAIYYKKEVENSRTTSDWCCGSCIGMARSLYSFTGFVSICSANSIWFNNIMVYRRKKNKDSLNYIRGGRYTLFCIPYFAQSNFSL